MIGNFFAVSFFFFIFINRTQRYKDVLIMVCIMTNIYQVKFKYYSFATENC